MRPMPTAIAVLFFTAALVPAAAHAQQAYPGTFYRVSSGLTQDQFAKMTADVGSLLRFRQMGDTMAIGRGHVDLGVQFGSAPLDNWRGPQLVGRFGVNNRVDLGVSGGLNPGNRYGLVGADAKVMLLNERDGWPVSISVRPSLSLLLGPIDVWAGTTGFDLTVSRAFGPLSPYAGVAATSSIAIERSATIDLDYATANASMSYAGVAYRWRALVVSGEVERGSKTNYAFRIGTRF